MGVQPLLELIENNQNFPAGYRASHPTQGCQRFLEAQLACRDVGKCFLSPASNRDSVWLGVASTYTTVMSSESRGNSPARTREDFPQPDGP